MIDIKVEPARTCVFPFPCVRARWSTNRVTVCVHSLCAIHVETHLNFDVRAVVSCTIAVSSINAAIGRATNEYASTSPR